MSVLDRFGRRADVLSGTARIHRLASRSDLVEVLALDERHREVVLTVDFTRVVHGNDMRVPQVARGIRLGVKRPNLLNARQLALRNRLQRDRPIGAQLPSTVDDPHRSPPQLLLQIVVAEVPHHRFRSSPPVRAIGGARVDIGSGLRTPGTRQQRPIGISGREKQARSGRSLASLSEFTLDLFERRRERFAVGREPGFVFLESGAVAKTVPNLVLVNNQIDVQAVVGSDFGPLDHIPLDPRQLQCSLGLLRSGRNIPTLGKRTLPAAGQVDLHQFQQQLVTHRLVVNGRGGQKVADLRLALVLPGLFKTRQKFRKIAANLFDGAWL